MSVESEQAAAQLVAVGLMAEHYGATRLAAAGSTFELDYEELRDLVALAYLQGKRDGVALSQSVVAGS